MGGLGLRIRDQGPKAMTKITKMTKMTTFGGAGVGGLRLRIKDQGPKCAYVCALFSTVGAGSVGSVCGHVHGVACAPQSCQQLTLP